jgi:hypothetical protein
MSVLFSLGCFVYYANIARTHTRWLHPFEYFDLYHIEKSLLKHHVTFSLHFLVFIRYQCCCKSNLTNKVSVVMISVPASFGYHVLYIQSICN